MSSREFREIERRRRSPARKSVLGGCKRMEEQGRPTTTTTRRNRKRSREHGTKPPPLLLLLFLCAKGCLGAAPVDEETGASEKRRERMAKDETRDTRTRGRGGGGERDTENIGSERRWQCLLPGPGSNILNSWTTWMTLERWVIRGNSAAGTGERNNPALSCQLCLRLMSLSLRSSCDRSQPSWLSLSVSLSFSRVRATARYPPINRLILHHLHRPESDKNYSSLPPQVKCPHFSPVKRLSLFPTLGIETVPHSTLPYYAAAWNMKRNKWYVIMIFWHVMIVSDTYRSNYILNKLLCIDTIVEWYYVCC